MSISETRDRAAEQENISFSTTAATEADFQALCQGFYMYATADVHVNFDEVATAGSFFVKKETFIHFNVLQATRVSAIGNSTTGTLYIIGRR